MRKMVLGSPDCFKIPIKFSRLQTELLRICEQGVDVEKHFLGREMKVSDSPRFWGCWGRAGGMGRAERGGIADDLWGLVGMGVLQMQGSATGAGALLSRLSWSWEPRDVHPNVGVSVLSAAQAGRALTASNTNGTPSSCFSPSLWAGPQWRSRAARWWISTGMRSGNSPKGELRSWGGVQSVGHSGHGVGCGRAVQSLLPHTARGERWPETYRSLTPPSTTAPQEEPHPPPDSQTPSEAGGLHPRPFLRGRL